MREKMMIRWMKAPMFKCTVNRTFDHANPEYGNTRRQFFLRVHSRVYQKSKSISDYFALLVCFESIKSKVSPKKLDCSDQN